MSALGALPALLVGFVTSFGHMNAFSELPLAVWSLDSSKLLDHSLTPPLHVRFGPRPKNVSGALLKPPHAGLCTWRQNMSAWQGRVILAGDWTSPGCSIEERARVLTVAGVAAIIFYGTEGLPLDWDGSDVSDIKVPAVVISRRNYEHITTVLTDKLTTHEARMDMDDFLNHAVPPPSVMVYLAPVDTPLLHDAAFLTFDRAVQVIFFVAAAANVCLALYQLIRFYLAAKQQAANSSNLQAGSALRVIGLELVSALAMCVFIIDGPGMEHTRPVILPWFTHRVALGIQCEFHMLALLVSSSHLRQIRKRVENRASGASRNDDATPEASFTRRAMRRSSIAVGDPSTGVGAEPSRCDRSSFYDGLFIVLLFGFVVIDNAIAVMTGLYLANDDMTNIGASYVTLVTIGIGFWFTWQAMVITKALRRVDTGKHRRVTRLSKSAMRIGTLMLSSAVRKQRELNPSVHTVHTHAYMNVMCLVHECGRPQIISIMTEIVVRPMLAQDGGWTYWWVMLPLWCIIEGTLLCATTLQILAFQPPTPKTSGSHKKTGGRVFSLAGTLPIRNADVTPPSVNKSTMACSPSHLRGSNTLRTSNRSLNSDDDSDALRTSAMSSMMNSPDTKNCDAYPTA